MLETRVTVITRPATAASIRLMLLTILLITIKRMETTLIGWFYVLGQRRRPHVVAQKADLRA